MRRIRKSRKFAIHLDYSAHSLRIASSASTPVSPLYFRLPEFAFPIHG
jgi:hypothetical protein